MYHSNKSRLLNEMQKVRRHAQESEDHQRCMVAPSPELRERIIEALAQQTESAAESVLVNRLRSIQRNRIGMNDGLIYPGSMFPVGTPVQQVRSAAANRAPLSGVVRVIVVLVEFSDQAMGETQAHFEELFFSQGVLANGSVREYFADVTNNIIDIQGQVVGPYELPRTLAEYAHGASGTGAALPNARTMARDAATAANPDVNFGPYDNDGDGFVDAFIVVHAGSGAEQTGSSGDIWSHKWVLSGGAFNADTTKIFAYLTVPEDSRIGVCCHELGHLLFGFPDLYDTDDSSEGIGNWCLMAGGSWNGGGDIPAHPSAWCKVNQGWANVNAPTTNVIGANIEDVKTSRTVYRLWQDGASGSEYFLVENRQRNGYDAGLPGEGLLIWHIDESIDTNEDETHYKVALEQADGKRDLENGSDRGDNGDSYPGSTNNSTFDNGSTPNSRSYAGVDTCVAVRNIGPPGAAMRADLIVQCGKSLIKDLKDSRKEKFEKDKSEKEIRKDKLEKDIKEKDKFEKDVKEKEIVKEKFEKDKSEKEIFEGKQPVTEGKQIEKGQDKLTDKAPEGKLTEGSRFAPGGFAPPQPDLAARVAELEARLAAIEPFISAGLRPDLSRGALASEEDLQLIQQKMQESAGQAKRQFDTKPRDV